MRSDAALYATQRGLAGPERYAPQKAIQLDRLAVELENTTRRIQAAQPIAKAIIKGRKMGRAAAIAERMKDTHQKFNAELDQVAVKLDEFDAKKPEVMRVAHATADSFHSEADELLRELAVISNIPLDK
jgi:hypothetical protein